MAQDHMVASSGPSPSSSSSMPESIAQLDASLLTIHRASSLKVVPEPDSPEVSTMAACTDHMITSKWTSSSGWQSPRLEPYGPLSIMPTASVLHYATECFEGMKVYRGYDGRLRLFRPSQNTRRMLQSALRIALPPFDTDQLELLIHQLCLADGDRWLPNSRPGTFLYLRPTMIATAATLAVQQPTEVLLYIIACLFPSLHELSGGPANSMRAASVPADPARARGMKLLASQADMVRAWPGGFGFAKIGANYGPSLLAQAEARERGYDQVLWLLGDRCAVTEAGASNFFVVWRSRAGRVELVTAPLEDRVILDGVTRRSVLELARERFEGVDVVERRFCMDELIEAESEGRLMEAFVAGTAFFITPVEAIHFRGRDVYIPAGDAGTDGSPGRLLAQSVKSWLTDIIYGKEQHPWGVVVGERGSTT